jgi:hypothetical protein
MRPRLHAASATRCALPLFAVVAVVCVLCATECVCVGRERGRQACTGWWERRKQQPSQPWCAMPSLVRGHGHPLTPLRSAAYWCDCLQPLCCLRPGPHPLFWWGGGCCSTCRCPRRHAWAEHICARLFCVLLALSCVNPVNRCAAQSASSPCQQCMHAPFGSQFCCQACVLPTPCCRRSVLGSYRSVLRHHSPLALSHQQRTPLFVCVSSSHPARAVCSSPPQRRCVCLCACVCVCCLFSPAWRQAHLGVAMGPVYQHPRVLRCCGDEA